jgi:hypothetical protein
MRRARRAARGSEQMSYRAIVFVACAGAPAWVFGQGYPPPEPAPQAPQAPQAQPPPAQPPPPAPAGSSASSATSGHTAAPGGAASQQVVVNPPQQTPPGGEAPPPSTTVVNPPPAYGAMPVVIERERRPPRNPMAMVATGAAYGGVAGLLVGVGVALVNQWDHWERDTMIGAGAGLIVGAGVGAVQATMEARDGRGDRVAFDGQGSTVRDPILARRPALALSGRF